MPKRKFLPKPRHANRPATLSGGPIITNPQLLPAEFKRSRFFYQFRRPDNSVSRVMRCSTAKELTWLMATVNEENPVMVQTGQELSAAS